jgi:hypothetical protein
MGSTEIILAPLSSLSRVLAHDMVADVTPVRTRVSVSFFCLCESFRDVSDGLAELERTGAAHAMFAVARGIKILCLYVHIKSISSRSNGLFVAYA